MNRNYQGYLVLKAARNLNSDRKTVRSELALNRIGEPISYHGPLENGKPITSNTTNKRTSTKSRRYQHLLQTLRELRFSQDDFKQEITDLTDLQAANFLKLQEQASDLLQIQLETKEKLQDLAETQQQKDLLLREELSQFEQKRQFREEWFHHNSRLLISALDQKISSLEQAYDSAKISPLYLEVFNGVVSKSWWFHIVKLPAKISSYLINTRPTETTETRQLAETKWNVPTVFPLFTFIYLSLMIVIWW